MEKGTYWAVLVLSLLLIDAFMWGFHFGPFSRVFYGGSLGEYKPVGNAVLVYPEKVSGYDQFMSTSAHEWMHYVYDEGLSRDEREEWERLVGVCGFESGYPFKPYSSEYLKLSEEFAECFELWYEGGEVCCAEKMLFIGEHYD